ncbi:MAG: L-rhamnose mutarotase [Thermoplasma sp.]|nr:MAG: L-rhamnose mutarotase [Thermoplasma sp.]
MRYAFHLKIKKGTEDEYIKRHRNVWPEMLDLLKKAGVRNYSIFIEDTDVFGYWECDDLSTTLDAINRSEINSKWQSFMSDIITTPAQERTGSGMKEVFHLP